MTKSSWVGAERSLNRPEKPPQFQCRVRFSLWRRGDLSDPFDKCQRCCLDAEQLHRFHFSDYRLIAHFDGPPFLVFTCMTICPNIHIRDKKYRAIAWRDAPGRLRFP